MIFNSVSSLPLTPFEHYMLADDTPAYPMVAYARLRFQGSLDRDRLQGAFEQALEMHPILNAKIVGDIRTRTQNLKWIPNDKPVQVIFHDSLEENGFDQLPRPINLNEAPGIRLHCFGTSNPTLIVQFHHSCCDGIGITHFAETLLLAYRDADCERREKSFSLTRNAEWWKTRTSNIPTWFANVKRFPFDLQRILAYHFKSNAPIATKKSSPKNFENVSDLSEFQTITLTCDETQNLILNSKAHQCSVNDLLLAKLFHTINEWNEQIISTGKKQNIRIGVPVNLRSADVTIQPAVNDVSMVFLDRTKEQIRNNDSLLATLNLEMTSIKKRDTGRAMSGMLRLAGALPGGMIKLLDTSGSKVTTVFSNYGRLFSNSKLLNGESKIVAGSLVLESIEPFPLIREGVRMAINAVTYAQQLVLLFNYDRRYFNLADADEFSTAFVNQIRNS